MFDSVLQSNLRKKGYMVSVFDSKEEAVSYITEETAGKSVGIGGSVTVQEMGLYEKLREQGDVYWHWCTEENSTVEDVRRAAASAQIYISSVNGIAETGEIVNIDGTGNRIASTIYGHEKVIFVIGRNKVAKDLAGAISRAKNIASPKNAQRLHCKLPCAVKGDKCYNCESPNKICRVTSVFDTSPFGAEYEIVLINEDLGY